MFSARQPAPGGGLPEPVFCEPLPQGSAYHELVERALNNDIIHGRLLSADGRLALIVLSLEPSVVDGGPLETIVNDIRQTMAEDLQGSGLTTTPSRSQSRGYRLRGFSGPLRTKPDGTNQAVRRAGPCDDVNK